MEDKIILLPFDEALSRYNQTSELDCRSILGLNRYDWNEIYEYCLFNRAMLLDVSTSSLQFNFGYYLYWVPTYCIDFKRSYIKSGRLIFLLSNLINE